MQTTSTNAIERIKIRDTKNNQTIYLYGNPNAIQQHPKFQQIKEIIEKRHYTGDIQNWLSTKPDTLVQHNSTNLVESKRFHAFPLEVDNYALRLGNIPEQEEKENDIWELTLNAKIIDQTTIGQFVYLFNLTLNHTILFHRFFECKHTSPKHKNEKRYNWYKAEFDQEQPKKFALQQEDFPDACFL